MKDAFQALPVIRHLLWFCRVVAYGWYRTRRTLDGDDLSLEGSILASTWTGKTFIPLEAARKANEAQRKARK